MKDVVMVLGLEGGGKRWSGKRWDVVDMDLASFGGKEIGCGSRDQVFSLP